MDKGDVEMFDAEKYVPSSYDLVSKELSVKCKSIAEDKTHDRSDSKGDDFKNARNEVEDPLNSKSQPEAHDNVVLENKTPTINAGMDDMDPHIEANSTTVTIDGDARLCEFPKVKLEVTVFSIGKTPEPSSPMFPINPSTANVDSEDDEGSPEDQAAFLGILGTFYWEKAMEFKPPRFYGHQLNCLKLWRSVIRLGGYDRISLLFCTYI
ncbi:hypothetical protein H5410_058807 [Solanum commersonii]|uniref:ARID domain-containing protein n=1 Tax=Solanum commersonii TaxID=4109 RepID=A0A9J5W0U7_SOLCO|nr:hypothetical protein H5410_058807 [Solanum commersonii]